MMLLLSKQSRKSNASIYSLIFYNKIHPDFAGLLPVFCLPLAIRLGVDSQNDMLLCPMHETTVSKAIFLLLYPFFDDLILYSLKCVNYLSNHKILLRCIQD